MEGTIYEFRVAAENRAGLGPFSDPTAPTELKDPDGNLCFFRGYPVMSKLMSLVKIKVLKKQTSKNDL